MKILHWLEDIRTPLLDKLMPYVSYAGMELFFMLVALFVLWCLSKRRGFYMLTAGVIGLQLNTILKSVFHVARPWEKDPSLTVVGAKPTGYSFPSGHAMYSTTAFGGLFTAKKNVWLRILCVLGILAVAFSRLYLGVHTPMDVLTSIAITLVVLSALYAMFNKKHYEKNRVGIAVFVVVLTIGLAVLTQFLPKFVDIAPEKQAENIVYMYQAGALALAVALGLIVDAIHPFTTQAGFVGQLLKFAIGAALFYLIRTGAGTVLVKLFGDAEWVVFARYLAANLFAIVIWPLFFPLFAKIGKKKCEE